VGCLSWEDVETVLTWIESAAYRLQHADAKAKAEADRAPEELRDAARAWVLAVYCAVAAEDLGRAVAALRRLRDEAKAAR
jgi:hypothetical protein